MTEPAADGSTTTTGVDARVASVLCYAGWWLTGLVFLVLEREHRAVRFHAAQSIVVFGGLTLLMIALAALTAMSLFVAPSLFRGVWALNWVVWLAGVTLWLVLMLQTMRGPGWRVPLAGDLAARIAGQ
jgi:uncharacterized membrane protein